MAGGESPTLSLRNANGISHSQSLLVIHTIYVQLLVQNYAHIFNAGLQTPFAWPVARVELLWPTNDS